MSRLTCSGDFLHSYINPNFMATVIIQQSTAENGGPNSHPDTLPSLPTEFYALRAETPQNLSHKHKCVRFWFQKLQQSWRQHKTWAFSIHTVGRNDTRYMEVKRFTVDELLNYGALSPSAGHKGFTSVSCQLCLIGPIWRPFSELYLFFTSDSSGADKKNLSSTNLSRSSRKQHF